MLTANQEHEFRAFVAGNLYVGESFLVVEPPPPVDVTDQSSWEYINDPQTPAEMLAKLQEVASEITWRFIVVPRGLTHNLYFFGV